MTGAGRDGTKGPIGAVLFDLDETLHDRTASLQAFLRDQHRRWPWKAVSADRFVAGFLRHDAHGTVPKPVVYRRLLAELGCGGADAGATAQPVFSGA